MGTLIDHAGQTDVLIYRSICASDIAFVVFRVDLSLLKSFR